MKIGRIDLTKVHHLTQAINILEHETCGTEEDLALASTIRIYLANDLANSAGVGFTDAITINGAPIKYGKSPSEEILKDVEAVAQEVKEAEKPKKKTRKKRTKKATTVKEAIEEIKEEGITFDTVRGAMLNLCEKRGSSVIAKEILAEIGVKKLSDLSADQRVQCMELIEKLSDLSADQRVQCMELIETYSAASQ
jgi:hypothetical protein